jgi:CDP-glycerol glycerophosphotransferase (TagB/SpsB family)
VHPRIAALRRYDLYLSPDIFILARRARVKVHTFHGISIKGKAFSEKAISFDKLFLIGPYQRRRFMERGILAGDDPRFVPVGMPKTDAFFDGSLDREAYLRKSGLDPARKTLLYAPTWRPESSLNRMGEALIRSIQQSPWNLMVKLHDHSYEIKNGFDWARKLEELKAPKIAIIKETNITPALYAADLLISDASSVANEYTLLDRPIVFIDVPELFEKYRDSIDLEGWGQSSGPVARNVDELRSHIEQSLADPSAYAVQRKRIADEGFYHPGRATEAALKAIDELLA